MDIYDRAQELEERERASCLARIQQEATKQTLGGTGACQHCDEPVGPEKRFCDADCRDQWERQQKAQARNGRGGME